MIVVVCARNEVWEAPDTGALDQYMPDAGATSTLGADFGSGSKGYAVYVSWDMRDLCVPYRAAACAVVRLVIADVDREAVGRRVRLSPSLDASPALLFNEVGGGL